MSIEKEEAGLGLCLMHGSGPTGLWEGEVLAGDAADHFPPTRCRALLDPFPPAFLPKSTVPILMVIFWPYIGALYPQVRAGERASSLAGIEEPEAFRGVEVPFQSVAASTAVHCSAQTLTDCWDLYLPNQVEVNQQKPMPNLDFFYFSFLLFLLTSGRQIPDILRPGRAFY